MKAKIRVYGECSFDDRVVVVDENPNSHKISKPNALHLIYVSFSPSILLLFSTMQTLAILPYTMEVLPRHS